MTTQSPPGLFIYGSCVARDMVRILPERYGSARYVARQSWISAFSEPTQVPEVDPELDSDFQKRMIVEDLTSRAPRLLRQVGPDAHGVLLDLIDERVGVVPTATGFATWSFELRHSAWRTLIPTGDPIPFGTSEHFELWAFAAERMAELLKEAGLSERAFVAQVNYATDIKGGGRLDSSLGRPVAEWDPLYAPYYERLARLGFQLLELPRAVAVSDPDHAWGPAPYHYIREYYVAMADAVTDGLAGRGGDR